MSDFDDLFEHWVLPPDDSWQTINVIAKKYKVGERVAKNIMDKAIQDGDAIMKEYIVKSNGRLVPHYKRVKKKGNK